MLLDFGLHAAAEMPVNLAKVQLEAVLEIYRSLGRPLPPRLTISGEVGEVRADLVISAA